METVTVTTSLLSVTCPISIGRGLIERLPDVLDTSNYSRISVVVDSGARTIGDAALRALSLPTAAALVLQGGEQCKGVQYLERTWQFFYEQRLDRKSLVVVIGGGALSDLVGFAAATYMRGVACAIIPTTLLAQVDAGIGGKTGCNFAGIKNLIGITQQPRAIVIDIDTLSGLPARELRSGFAEVAKHGLIADCDYFSWVTSKPCSDWNAEELVSIIAASCAIKARIVQSDETERGARKTLNFGHTIGHAIEALSFNSGSQLAHGEAVAIGMHAEGLISCRVGMLAHAELEKLTQGLRTVGLPIHLSQRIKREDIQSCMSLDKKNVGGKTRWTLLRSIGNATFDHDVPQEIIDEAINAIQPIGC